MNKSTPETPPRIWVLTGAKGGDNAQVLAAARAMGLPFEVKHLAIKAGFEMAKPAVKATLRHVDPAASDRLEAPWPDLVITIGRRLSMAALWIKEQSEGKTRIALFNAPKGRHEDFDLIVAPAYYRIAEAPGVCRIGLPLLAVDSHKIEAARAEFAVSIGAMARPLTVLLLGGATSMLRLDAEVAQGILAKLRGRQRSGGSLYVSTSRRTPPGVAEAIEPLLGPQDRLFRWSPEAEENPYFGLLAHGDNFVVTGDSISMIIEIARLGRPLAIAELPKTNMRILRALRALGWNNPQGNLACKLLELGTGGQTRDFERLYSYLAEKHIAVKLGLPPWGEPDALPDDLTLVAERLRRLSSVAEPAD